MLAFDDGNQIRVRPSFDFYWNMLQGKFVDATSKLKLHYTLLLGLNWVGLVKWQLIQKEGYAGMCTQRTVLFSKRRKNCLLCAEQPAVWFLQQLKGLIM
jgi:hypothetical protein